MRVKCLAQEHNLVPLLGLEPRPFDPEFSALTIRPLRLPLRVVKDLIFILFMSSTLPFSSWKMQLATEFVFRQFCSTCFQ